MKKVKETKKEQTPPSEPPMIQQKLDLVKFTEIMLTVVNTVNLLQEKMKTREAREAAFKLEIKALQDRNAEYIELLKEYRDKENG